MQCEQTHQVFEEWLGAKVRIVLLGQCAVDVDDLEGSKLESPSLEARDDLSDESTLKGRIHGKVANLDTIGRPAAIGRYLDSVGLDHDVAPLLLGHFTA